MSIVQCIFENSVFGVISIFARMVQVMVELEKKEFGCIRIPFAYIQDICNLKLFHDSIVICMWLVNSKVSSLVSNFISLDCEKPILIWTRKLGLMWYIDGVCLRIAFSLPLSLSAGLGAYDGGQFQ